MLWRADRPGSDSVQVGLFSTVAPAITGLRSGTSCSPYDWLGTRTTAGLPGASCPRRATSDVLGDWIEAATLARAARVGISRVATPTPVAQFHAMEARALARKPPRLLRAGTAAKSPSGSPTSTRPNSPPHHAAGQNLKAAHLSGACSRPSDHENGEPVEGDRAIRVLSAASGTGTGLLVAYRNALGVRGRWAASATRHGRARRPGYRCLLVLSRPRLRPGGAGREFVVR